MNVLSDEIHDAEKERKERKIIKKNAKHENTTSKISNKEKLNEKRNVLSDEIHDVEKERKEGKIRKKTGNMKIRPAKHQINKSRNNIIKTRDIHPEKHTKN